jgi:hypothetical protein
VLDSTNQVVDALSSTGEFICQITGTKPASKVGEERECNHAAGSDTPSHGFSTPRGITVDQATGEVYVLDPEHEAVDVFSTGGEYLAARSISLATIPGGFSGASNTRGIAVNDFNGHVLISDSGPDVIFEFTGAGAYVTTWTGGECQAGSANVGEPKACTTPAGSLGSGYVSVASDNASGRVYITDTADHVTDVFDASGRYLTQITHSFTIPRGAAVDQANGGVYVSDNSPALGPGIVDVFAALLVPDVVTEAPSELTPTSVTFNGKVNPQGLALTECRFEYGTTTSYGQSAPCVPAATAIPTDSIPHSVTAHVTGLAPGTVYHYRLVAANVNGTNSDEPAKDLQFQTLGPAILDSSVSDVASTSATFAATLIPFGHPTSYYFQYATAPDFSNATDAPAPPGEAIGSGAGEVKVSQDIQVGLSPGTLYYYRVVALSELTVGSPQAFFGPAHTFTTESVSGFALPDGRQWELVSPPDKHGAQLESDIQAENPSQAAADGGAMTYLAAGPTESQPPGFQNLMQIFSTRTPEGWRSQDIEIPHLEATAVAGGGTGQEYRLFSSDLSLGALLPFGGFDPALSAEASAQTPYLRSDFAAPGVPCSESCYRPLVTGKAGYANVPEGTQFGPTGECSAAELNTENVELYCGPRFQGATPDFKHLVLSSNVPLTTEVSAPGPQHVLYEWTAGALKAVSVLPVAEGGAATTGELGAVKNGNGVSVRSASAVSLDGSHVVWSPETKGPRLYLSDMSGAHAVSVRLDSGLTGPTTVFQVANSAGTEVLFTDEEKLFEYRAGVGRELVAESVPNEMPVLGMSGDGSRVYFVAEKVITGVAGAVNGKPNLYVRHGGNTELVAVLSSKDSPDWATGHTAWESTARVSPDGRWLTFMSEQPLTGYDNRDVNSDERVEEVYLYDGQTGRLRCASCNSSGARPVGTQSCGPNTTTHCNVLALGKEQTWTEGQWLAANVPGWTVAGYQSRYLSDIGRVFFNSFGPLVPQDVNGTWDVYEWEPVGVGGCSSSAAGFSEGSGGCVALVSSGRSPEESAFVDASESGGDVFFFTNARLVGADYDTSRDLYDAHECSVSACFPAAVASPPPCSTEASCKAGPTPQPDIFGAPSSATFTGRGNPAPPPPPKPKTAAQIRAENLTKALKACKKDKKRSKRLACERTARKKYGAVKARKSTKAKKASNKRRAS